ncbi:MAG: type IV pilus secretin PilQ [Pseudomonadota bacterium]
MKFMHKWLYVAALLAGLSSLANGAVPSEGATEVAAGNSIDSLMVSRSGGSTVIKIGFRQALMAKPSHFSIANPARLVFDLPGVGNSLGYTTKTVNEGGLRTLNVVQSGERTRLVLNLDRMARFESRHDGQSWLISLKEDGAGGGATVQQFAGNDRPEVQSIRDIRFRRSKDGAGVVVVDMSASDTGIDVQQKGAGLFVSFKKTQLPDHLRRQLDVVDFATPITAVKTAPEGDSVVMEIVPKGLWEHVAFQSDNQFVVEVRPVKDDPNKLFQGSKTGYQGEAISLNFQNIPLRELLHVFADITNFNIVVSDSVTGNVSLRLNDVPWDHALEIVLQQKNLAMRKSGNVLWIAPRDELAARDKLEAEARDAAVAAEIPRLEVFQLNYQKAEDFATMLSGGAPGTAGGGAGAGSGSKDNGAGSTFLSSQGRITIDKRTNQAFIYDVPSKLELVRGLLAKIDRPARQVLIEARIVEADTSFSKALGARLGGHDLKGMDVGHNILGTNLRYGISASTKSAYTHLPERAILGSPATVTDATTGVTSQTLAPYYLPGTVVSGATAYQTPSGYVREIDSDPAMGDSQFSNNAVTAPTGQFALSLFNSAKSQILTLELTAREADGLSKLISSPRVLTADQVEAKIEQGYRIPYPCASSSGAISICWSNAVLSLKVKPQITPDGRVMMNIQINKDAPGEEGRWGYTVKTKEIKSDVLVENGGTVVIGGVFELDESESNTRVPILGDLPYVGFLFKQKTKREVKTELIIMITPRVVDDALAVKL